MAELVEKSVEELEKEITCAVCHGHYNEPKVLPCFHYCCKDCIYKMIKTDYKSFYCNKCSMHITLPQGSVDDLPTAFFINHLKQLHSKLGKAHGKMDAKCELCHKAKTKAFCQQCTGLICAHCVKSHQKMKNFADHKISYLKGGLSVRDIVMTESPLQMCKLHKEPMKFYCFDCSSLICRDGTIKTHFGHNYEFVNEIALEMKEKLYKHLDPLKEVEVSLSNAVKEIESTRLEIETQGDYVKNKLENWFKHFHNIIEHQQQKLLNEVATKVTCKLNCLSAQEKKLSTEREVVQRAIEYTESCAKHLTDNEIMGMNAEITSQIESEIKEHCKEGRNLEPEKEVDIGVEVSCAEELKQFCQTKAKVTQIPIECTVKDEKVKNAEINKSSKLSVIIKFSDGKNVKQKHGVDCHLKTLHNGSTVKCKVDLIQDNEYVIEYKPTCHGRHILVLTINGQEISGSPSVFVRFPPSRSSWWPW